MSEYSDEMRKKLSEKLCSLLDVHVDCYEPRGIDVYDLTADAMPIYLPWWLVKRILKLRPPLSELSEQQQYENRLIHTRPIDIEFVD